jgi:hypothetical protein
MATADLPLAHYSRCIALSFRALRIPGRTTRELLPRLEPAGFDQRDAWKLDGIECDASALLSLPADRDNGQLAFEIEVFKGHLLAQ